MGYQIKYSYRTGDSFRTEDREAVLEMVWESKEVARANLQRIKEHYQYYEARRRKRYWDYDSEEYKRKQQQIVAEAKNKDWAIMSRYGKVEEVSEFSLKLKTDEGKDWQIGAPWCGYFESLYGADIIIARDDDEDSIRF